MALHTSDFQLVALFRAHVDGPDSTNKKKAKWIVSSSIQCKLHELQGSWPSSKTDDIQAFADSRNMNKFCDGLREVCSPTRSLHQPLMDGTILIMENAKVLER